MAEERDCKWRGTAVIDTEQHIVAFERDVPNTTNYDQDNRCNRKPQPNGWKRCPRICRSDGGPTETLHHECAETSPRKLLAFAQPRRRCDRFPSGRRWRCQACRRDSLFPALHGVIVNARMWRARLEAQGSGARTR
jgi:hypothetical protein